MWKILVAVVLVLALFPVVMKLLPKPLAFEEVRDAFSASGMTVTGYTPMTPPQLDAVEHVTMNVDGAVVNLYRFDDEGKIAAQMAYQQQDPGEAMAESMGLRQQLGAAPPPPATAATRRGKVMMTVTSTDRNQIRRLLSVLGEI